MKISKTFTIDGTWLANCVDPKIINLAITALKENDQLGLKDLIIFAELRLSLLQKGAPDSIKILYNIVFSEAAKLLELSNYYASREKLNWAIYINSVNADSFGKRAACNIALNDQTKAIWDYTKAIFLSRDKLSYYEELAKIYLEMDNKAMALSVINAIKKKSPDNKFVKSKIDTLKDVKESMPEFSDKIETEPKDIVDTLNSYIYLSISLNNIKKEMYEIGSIQNFNLDESSHQKGTLKQIEAFENIVAQIQALTLENDARAHSLFGYLYERGLVTDISMPSGYYLSVIGSNFHYAEYIRLAEGSGYISVDKTLKDNIKEIMEADIISSNDKTKSWRLRSEAKNQFLFNQAISYELEAGAVKENLGMRYYYGWAQYFYERTAGVYGAVGNFSSAKAKGRSFYNLGMLYKLGKGLVNPDADNLIEKMPMMLMAQEYFEYSIMLKYAPAYYELYKMHVKGITVAYVTQEQMIEVYMKASSLLEKAVDEEYGPALKAKGHMLLNTQYKEGINRKSAIEEAALLFDKSSVWYLSVNMEKNSKNMKSANEQAEEYVKDSGIINEPYYHLVSYKFSHYLKQRCIGFILEVALFESLKGFAKKNNLPFAKEESKTREKVKNFANHILSMAGIKIVAEVSNNQMGSKEAMDLEESTTTKKHFFKNSLKEIKSFIDEGDKWTDDRIDLPDWINKFNKFLEEELISDKLAIFKKYNLIEELKEKISKFSIPSKSEQYDPKTAFSSVIDSCQKQLDSIKKIAKRVYYLIPWQIRSLREQLYYYDIGYQLLCSGEIYFNDENVRMVRGLLMRCHFIEEGMEEKANKFIYQERIRKHCNSVISIKEYAIKNKMSITTAIKEIDSIMLQLLVEKNLSDFDIAHLGYNCAVNLINIQKLKTSPFINNVTKFVADKHKQRTKLNDYTTFNATWLSGKPNPTRWVSLTGNIAECSLIAIFDRAVKTIDGIKKASHPNEENAIFNYKAITYNDPYVYLYARDIDDYYIKLNEKVLESMKSMNKASLEAAAQGSDPLIIFYMNHLQEAYNRLITTLKLLVPSTAIISDISRDKAITKLTSLFMDVDNEKLWRTVNYKKLFLLYLKSFIQSKNVDNIIFGLHQLFWGLEGRCIDGKYSYFNEWFVEFTKNSNENINKLKDKYGKDSIKNLELRIRISQLILELKKNFLNKHLTRTKEDKNSETLLCSKVLLYQLLMQPLGIPGIYTELKYAGYSMEKIKNIDKIFKIEELINKFFNGGEISFSAPDHSNKILPMTLERLMNIIRLAIHRDDGPIEEQDPYFAIKEEEEDETMGGKLYPYDKIYTKIPYRLIEDYINSDIATIIDYKAYLDSNFSKPTTFFKAEGQDFKRILSNKFMIKMLSEFGYAEIIEL